MWPKTQILSADSWRCNQPFQLKAVPFLGYPSKVNVINKTNQYPVGSDVTNKFPQGPVLRDKNLTQTHY